MDINYKIVQLDKEKGSIRVLYTREDFPEGYLFDLNLPVNEDGSTLSVEELSQFIMFNAPAQQIDWAIQQKNKFAQVDFSHIEALVEPMPAPLTITDKISDGTSQTVPSQQVLDTINEMTIPTTQP